MFVLQTRKQTVNFMRVTPFLSPSLVFVFVSHKPLSGVHQAVSLSVLCLFPPLPLSSLSLPHPDIDLDHRPLSLPPCVCLSLLSVWKLLSSFVFLWPVLFPVLHGGEVVMWLRSYLFASTWSCSTFSWVHALHLCFTVFSINFGEFVLIRIEDLRTEGIICYTDCEAPWGKFVICDIGLCKWNWLDLKERVTHCNECNTKHMHAHTGKHTHTHAHTVMHIAENSRR